MPVPCDAWRALGAAGLRLAAPDGLPKICVMPAPADEGGRFAPEPPTSGPTCYNPWMMFRGEGGMVMEDMMAAVPVHSLQDLSH